MSNSFKNITKKIALLASAFALTVSCGAEEQSLDEKNKSPKFTDFIADITKSQADDSLNFSEYDGLALRKDKKKKNGYESKCDAKNAKLKDSDQDGIPDRWEKKGADVDCDGQVDIDLPAMGANPRRKNIFIEIDYMVHDDHTHLPPTEVLRMFADAFAKSPVSNPDGSTGIDVYFDIDEAVEHMQLIGGHALYNNRQDYSTPERKGIFYHVLYAHSLDLPYKGSSGIALMDGM